MISGDTALAQGKKGAFYNTLEEFHKYWDRIDIITPKTDQKIDNIFGNVFIHSPRKSKIFQPWFIKEKGKEIHKKEKFDVITVHEFPPFYNGIGARLLWQRIKVPYILEIHHIPGYPKPADIKEKIYRWITKFFIKFDASKAKVVRVVNKKQVPDFLERAGVETEKIKYISSMYIDLDKFKKTDAEKKYDLIFVARIEKNKGIFKLIDAVDRVRAKKPNISLLIVGKGNVEDAARKYIKEKELEENVHLAGWVDDLVSVYNSARIFVNPSFNEGGPRVALEAMACGLPMVTTRVGLMIDIIEDRTNGLFADWDSGDMAEKILELINDEEMMRRFSDINIGMVKKFEESKSVENYANEIKNVIT